MDRWEYLTELTPELYRHKLNPAQQMTVIIDIAESMGFTAGYNGIIRTDLSIAKPEAVNDREPFVTIYNNAARATCNNGHLMYNTDIKVVWVEAIEFECGYRKPTAEWYQRRQTTALPGINNIEIHQESINVDATDLNAVKKLLTMWYKVMNYDWEGQLICDSIKG